MIIKINDLILECRYLSIQRGKPAHFIDEVKTRESGQNVFITGAINVKTHGKVYSLVQYRNETGDYKVITSHTTKRGLYDVLKGINDILSAGL